MTAQYAVCLVTAGSQKNSRVLARGLVENKLAACVSIIPGISSVYSWKGKTEAAKEFLLIIKTRKTLSKQVEKFILAKHEYETPEIIFLPITAGNAQYLAWIGNNTKHENKAKRINKI